MASCIMEKRIKILIAGLFQEAEKIAISLRQLSNTQVLGYVFSGEQAINHTPALAPDIIFISAVTEGITGVETARWILEQNPTVKIILLSTHFNPEFFRIAKEMGLHGYLPLNAGDKSLQKAIETVDSGNRYFTIAKIENQAVHNPAYLQLNGRAPGPEQLN